MENVAIILDDPFHFDFLGQSLYKKSHDELRNFHGMKGWAWSYKGVRLFLLCGSRSKELFLLQMEDLLASEKFKFVVNLGHCCFFNNSRVSDLKFVIVSLAKSSSSNHLLDDLSESFNEKNLNAEIEEQVLMLAKNQNLLLKPVSCYSFEYFDYQKEMNWKTTNCLVFDNCSFSLYELSEKYGTPVVCIFEVRENRYIDIDHYFFEKLDSQWEKLFKFVLDLSVSCVLRI